MGTTAMAYEEFFEEGPIGGTKAALMCLPRVTDQADQRSGPVEVEPPVLTPGRVMLANWLAAERWFEFSRGEQLPADWLTGERDPRCGNCGASASSPCSLACPGRRPTFTGDQRLPVQVPCGFHQADEVTAAAAECPHCVGGLVTVAWATVECAPLRVVGYRYRLRRSKPNQFELSDGSYHDADDGIEPICLPGRWARGGSIAAAS